MNEEHSTEQPCSVPSSAASLQYDGATLSDEALSAGGLAKVYAFVRKEYGPNAVRSERARQKATQAGSGQLNVVVPLAAHRVVKAMAKELQKGAPVTEALTALLAAEVKALHPGVVVRVMSEGRAREADALAKKISALHGWRLWVAHWLGAA